jgi:hypothetical protein
LYSEVSTNATNEPIGAETDAEPMKLRLVHPLRESTVIISSVEFVVVHSSNMDDGTALKLCGNVVWAYVFGSGRQLQVLVSKIDSTCLPSLGLAYPLAV